MNSIEAIKIINYTIGTLFVLCYAYQIAYILVPFLKKDKPHAESVFHRFAVLISARNEETVIANLIDSIKKQDYPAELVTVFVVADNCTDRTADIARNAGAVVYERFNKANVGKGYALDYLLQQIHRNWGEDAFDGYFVFDADNLLSENYITEMNKTFSDGYSIVTSYRNSKNFDDNWISAGYAVWFLREAEFLNHARMLTGNSCAISGCGFLFGNNILKKCGGWKFYLLTEDIEFTIKNIVDGEKIGYCKSAVFYDEQPIKFSQSWKQRMRWAKGYLQVFGKYGGRLFRGLGQKNAFSCFDMTMSILPAIALTILSVIANLTVGLICIGTGTGLMYALSSALESVGNGYLFMFLLGVVTTVSQWKMIHTTAAKKLWYMLTFPVFMMTYIPIAFISIFKKVEWSPIEHTVALSIVDMGRK